MLARGQLVGIFRLRLPMSVEAMCKKKMRHKYIKTRESTTNLYEHPVQFLNSWQGMKESPITLPPIFNKSSPIELVCNNQKEQKNQQLK